MKLPSDPFSDTLQLLNLQQCAYRLIKTFQIRKNYNYLVTLLTVMVYLMTTTIEIFILNRFEYVDFSFNI